MNINILTLFFWIILFPIVVIGQRSTSIVLSHAVAWHNTRFEHLSSSTTSSCTGMPQAKTVMGLYDHGHGVFRENLQLVSDLSGITASDILSDERIALNAYAFAIDSLLPSAPSSTDIAFALSALSEFPVRLTDSVENNVLYLPVVSFLSEVARKASDAAWTVQLGFDPLLNFAHDVFTEEWITIHSMPRIMLSETGIYNMDLHDPIASSLRSSDYSQALWNPTSCNYSSRSGTDVSAITIHTVQGSYSGCIAWFQNCNSNVSAHYVIRSSDGQVTQMVRESDKAWHVGSENPYTIGYEHEGYVSNPAWYTETMYRSSANLTRDILASGYDINGHRTAYYPWTAATNYNEAGVPGSCNRIKGHQHFPNQTHTDPGEFWDWDFYYKLINEGTLPQVYTQDSGVFYDSGGPFGDYDDDERLLYQIQGNGPFQLSFEEFDLEEDWDYLFLYEGPDEFSPLIGQYSGNIIPNTLVMDVDTLMIEFRSDCATKGGGYAIQWKSLNDTTDVNPVDSNDVTAIERNRLEQLSIYPNPANTHIRFALRINALQRKVYNYNMVNQLGQIVKEGALAKTGQGEFSIATEDLPPGFYYLFITDAFQENISLGSFIKTN